MERLDNLNLRGIPEKFKEEGVFAHYKELVRVGDIIEANCNVNNGEIPLGTKVKIADIIVNPMANIRGFEKRIKLEGYSGDYNPKRFKKVEGADNLSTTENENI